MVTELLQQQGRPDKAVAQDLRAEITALTTAERQFSCEITLRPNRRYVIINGCVGVGFRERPGHGIRMGLAWKQLDTAIAVGEDQSITPLNPEPRSGHRFIAKEFTYGSASTIFVGEDYQLTTERLYKPEDIEFKMTIQSRREIELGKMRERDAFIVARKMGGIGSGGNQTPPTQK